MKVVTSTILLICLQQILMSNCQINRPPPILQWLLPGLNGINNNQRPQQPQSPFNPLNFLQLIRPAPSRPNQQTPANPQSTPTGIIPLFLQQFLQRPAIGGQQQNDGQNNGGPLNSGITPNTNIGGNAQNPGANLGNLFSLQQLLQGNTLGNIPILLGIQQIGGNPASATLTNGNIIVRDNVTEINPIVPPTQHTETNPIAPPINPNIQIQNNNLNSIPPYQSDLTKPVTEISNEIDITTTEQPFVSLVPIKPIEPDNLTQISYVPYTTTIKPFTTISDFQSDATVTNPSNVNTKVTTESPSPFVSLFFERRETTPQTLSSNHKDILIQDTTRSDDVDATENTNLFSKFITGPTPDTNSEDDNQQLITSAPIILITKFNQKESQVVKNESKENIECKPSMETNQIGSQIKPILTSIKDKTSQPKNNTLSKNEEETALGELEIQMDELPNKLIQRDELPNTQMPNTNLFGLYPIINYPPVLFNQQNPDLIDYNFMLTGPTLNAGIPPNPDKVFIVNEPEMHPDFLYDNIPPHFAYSTPYMNWPYQCPPWFHRHWMPLPFDNGPFLNEFPG